MAEISASQVVELRKITGQGMMDCKKALEESGGDVNKAVEILRKKGLATLTKRAGRETTEGLVVLVEGDNWASLATLCCETDFVARSDPFRELVDALVDGIKESKPDTGPENILKTSVKGKKYSDVITEAVSKTGEKLQVCDYERYVLSEPGRIGTYIHFNGKVGAIVEIGTDTDATAKSDAIVKMASDMAMHITATKPMALDESGISAEVIEQEKSIAAAQIKNKPANIVDKIVEGKMKKFFAENCLLLQQFVKDNTKTVAQVLAEAAKQSGGQAQIKRFVRFEVG